MIQCNQQMTQGRASTYLHSVTQSARFIPVLREFFFSFQIMHDKRISEVTSFQRVIRTAHRVDSHHCSLVKDLEGNWGLLSEI
jgi:hypothetical protein